MNIIIHCTHYQHSDWPRAPCLFWEFTWFCGQAWLQYNLLSNYICRLYRAQYACIIHIWPKSASTWMVSSRALIRWAVKRAGPTKKVWCSRLWSTKAKRFHLLTLEIRFLKKLQETPFHVNQQLFWFLFCSEAFGQGEFQGWKQVLKFRAVNE